MEATPTQYAMIMEAIFPHGGGGDIPAWWRWRYSRMVAERYSRMVAVAMFPHGMVGEPGYAVIFPHGGGGDIPAWDGWRTRIRSNIPAWWRW